MKSILSNIRYSKFFLRFFSSIIAILILVTIIFSWFLYTKLVLDQKNDIIEGVNTSLKDMENNINNKLGELLKIVININSNYEFFYKTSNNSEQGYTMAKELERYTLANSFIRDMSYYSLLDEDKIYSNQGIYSNELFSKYIYDISNLDEEDFYNRKKLLTIGTISSNNFVFSRTLSPMMAFIYGLPIGTETQKRFVTFFVDKNRIDEIINDSARGTLIDFYIYEMNTPIYSLKNSDYNTFLEPSAFSDSMPYEKDGFIYFSLKSEYNGWTYIIKYNKKVLFSDYYRYRFFYIMLIFIILLLMLFTASLIALFNYKPIYKLVSKYKGSGSALPGKLEYDEIAYINRLVESEIRKKTLLHRNLFVSNLIWGQYENAISINLALQEANIIFESESFTCCTIFYHPKDENTELQKDALMTMSENILDLPDCQAVSADLYNQQSIVIIINHINDKRALENIKSAMELFAQDASKKYNCIISIGISNSCKTMEDIPLIYNQSVQSAYYSLLNGITAVKYNNIDVIIKGEQFLELKQNITDCINRGNPETLLSKINTFIQQLDSGTVTPQYLYHMILDYIVNTFSHMCQDNGNEIIKNCKIVLLNPLKIDDLVINIEKLCNLLCSFSINTTKKQNTELKDKIIDFINKNLCDSTLTLEVIASECNITASYLVRYFKGQTGYTPMQYVDMRRMELAKNLLINGNYNLNCRTDRIY